jgi:hypothetical protein
MLGGFELKRLTMCIDNHYYYSDNGKPILPVEILDTPKVREVLKKLAEYEETGLAPDVMKYKLDEINQLKADLSCKDNDIAVLKWRVNYLEQFKPKEEPNYCCSGVDLAKCKDFTVIR